MNSKHRRVVVLGASNATRGLRSLIDTAGRTWGRPLEVLAAIGHGRSYGRPSRVMGRSLPGILECDLWDEWRARQPAPTAGLVTDIGNDILFGHAPEQIAAWVRECLRRLRATCERIVVTELPLDSVATIGPRRFLFFRSLLFPKSNLSLEQALGRAREVNRLVRELAREHQAVVVQPDLAWYGLDPIHIRRRHEPAAWREILAAWRVSQEAGGIPGGPGMHSLSFWRHRPKYRRVLGIEQHTPQPAVQLADGSNISLY